MSTIQQTRAFLLAGALPAVLLFPLAACSVESDAPGSTKAVAGATPEAPVEQPVTPAEIPEVPSDQAAPTTQPASTTPTSTPRAPAGQPAAASNIPAGHSADDGHDHGPARPPVAGTVRPAGADDSPILGNLKGPRLATKVGGDKHVFGPVMQGTIAEHTFELESGGTEALIIKQVKPTCGCTVTQVLVEGESGELEKYTFGDPIAVGRRISFPAKLHTKNKSGHQNTRINIFSNDPRGTVQLGLEADINPFFTIAPRFLNYGQISAGDVVTKMSTIQAAQGAPIKLELVEQTLPAGGSYELKPTNPDADGRAVRWELSVTLGPELTEGNLARSLMMKSDEPIPGADQHVDGTPMTYQASLTVSAQVVGPFSYNPAYLSMGLVRPGQVQARTVTVESHDEAFSFTANPPRIRIVGLQSPGTSEFRDWEYAEYFTPTIRPVDGKNAIDIELRLEGMPDGATGSFRGTMVIELGHPDKPQLALVITGVCRGGPAK